MTLTITEALAELKTIGKRLEKKKESVLYHLFRQGVFKDPLEKDGGSKKYVAEERQSIHDLQERVVNLRRAIACANERTVVTVGGKTRTVAAWLTWRKEVAPGEQKFLATLKAKLDAVRREAQSKGVAVAEQPGADKDIVVHLSEKDIAVESEQLENILGTLDGLLSLKNATVTVEVV